MAADKKTLLRDALKQVQSGKIEKAIETYRAVVKVDPRDGSVHNSLGDLLARIGKKKEAIAEYLEASTLFERDGFALRSIAVCQKVVNLDQERWDVKLKLGDLYAVQKLPAESRAAYLVCAERCDKRGEVGQALEIFRKIANLDPDNLPARVKLAGMFEKQKRPAQAAEEYVRAAKGYLERKEADTAVQLYVRAFKLSPANLEARRRLADFYAQRKDWPVVAGLLETPVAKGSHETALLVLYAEALTQVNHPADAVKALEKAQAREPNSLPVNLGLGRAFLKLGDVERGTEALNRCVGAYLSENKLDLAEALLREMSAAAPEEEKVFQRILEVSQKRGDAGAIAEAYLKIAAVHEKKGLVRSAAGALEKYLELKPQDAAAARRLDALKGQAPAPKAEAPPPAAPAAETPPPAPRAAPAPVAEWKATQPAPPPPAEEDVVEIDLEGADFAPGAVAEEEFHIEVEGEEEAAAVPEAELSSVAEARAAVSRGAPGKASEFLEEHLGSSPADVEAWEALAEARRAAGRPSEVRDALLRLADLHRRAARFDEARAAYKGALDIDPRNALAAQGLAALVMEEAAAAPPPAEELPEPAVAKGPEPAAGEELPEVLEIAEEEAAEDLALAEAGEMSEFLEAAEEAAEGEIDVSEAGEIPEVRDTAVEAAADLGESGAAAPGQTAAELPPEPVAAAAAYDTREEIDLQAVAGAAGATEPVAAGGGTEEEALRIPIEGEAEAPAAGPPEAEAAFRGFEEFLEEPAAAPPPEKIAIPETGTGTGEIDEFLAEADFYLQQGLLDEAESLYAKLAARSPGNPVIAARLEKVRQQRPPAPAPGAGGVAVEPDLGGLEVELDLALGEGAAAPAPVLEGAPDYSDFLADLRTELEGGGEVAAPPPPQEQAGLDDIFQEFQRSVKEQLGDEDYETHYNLGIAYKEMGLLDEAIAEFALAEKSPERRMNAVSMISLCLLQSGRFDEAAQKMRNGISLALEGSEDQKGFLYDLAGLHEQAGRAAEAREALERLHAMDPGYRDVAARLGVAAPAVGAPRKRPKVSYL